MKQLLHSLRFRLLLTILGMLALLSGAVIYNGYRILNAAMVENLRVSVKQTSQILNLAISPFSIGNDLKTLQVYLSELIDSENTNRGLLYVAIASEGNEILLYAGGSKEVITAPLPEPDDEGGYDLAVERGVVHVRQAILLADNAVGYMQYGLSTKLLSAANRQSTRQGLILMGFGMLLSATFMLYLSLLFARRIETLISATAAISAGNYDQTAPESGQDEISQLAHHFNRMGESIRQRIDALEESRAEVALLNEDLERRVLERTQELATVNQTLESTIINLNRTQESLVHSEKLAGLGSLVAGIAHELNTPLGNALTVGTTIEERTREFVVEVEKGLKRSMLNNYVEMLQTSTPLLTRNLTRAAELITSFKHVAVDQTSSQQREFNLSQVIHEVADTLQHTYKKTPYTLVIDIPENMLMDSYPGPLGQIVTNLINNALVHAFAGRDHGQMKFHARYAGADKIALEFSDDGQGITSENLKRIFDPFFTTRMGQGGSGLGLNIVHNIVEGLLGGNIRAESEPGKGTRFILELPINAPRTPNAS